LVGLSLLGRGDPDPGRLERRKLAGVHVDEAAEYGLDYFGADRGLFGVVLWHGRHRTVAGYPARPDPPPAQAHRSGGWRPAGARRYHARLAGKGGRPVILLPYVAGNSGGVSGGALELTLDEQWNSQSR